MRKFFFLIFIFLITTSCATNSITSNKDANLDFSENMSISQFILKLEEYSKNKPYPNIDN